jgi:hypothetical protein
MTEEQLKAAALLLCEKQHLDPDAITNSPSYPGMTNLESHIEVVRLHWLVHQAIDEAFIEPSISFPPAVE